MVVAVIGAALLIAVVGIIALAMGGHPIPDVLQNIAVAAVAGLLGLLAPSGRSAETTP